MNGNTPTLISGHPKRTPSWAMTRSQARARPKAPASTSPLAAQITGLPRPPMSLYSRGKRSSPAYLSIVGVSPANAFRSPPAEKTRPCEEVSTTTRTASSVRARSNASMRSSRSSSLKALRDSGASRVTKATPRSSTSERTRRVMGPLPRSSGLENDLAEAGSGFEVGMCGGGFVQGERPVDDGGRNGVAVEQGEQAREVTGTAHGGAEQVELAEVEAPHVEACMLGAGG